MQDWSAWGVSWGDAWNTSWGTDSGGEFIEVEVNYVVTIARRFGRR
jgi:hypothetical protein